MARHVRKNDQVMVVTGKEKGKRGRVLEVRPETGRVLVENVNMVKKHRRPGVGSRTGGIIEKEAPLHLSNVMPIDPKTDEPTRIRLEKNKDGKKVRVAKKSGSELPS